MDALLRFCENLGDRQGQVLLPPADFSDGQRDPAAGGAAGRLSGWDGAKRLHSGFLRGSDTLCFGGFDLRCDSLRNAAKIIEELSYFVLSFIPVFSGVAAVAGRPASAAAYQSVTFAAAQFFSQIAANAVVPLLGIFLAVCTVGAVSDAVDVQGIAQSVKKAANWLLALCLTIFVGLLSVQSMVTGAADTVGNRTVKFVISSTVPVVGGALSEAYGSLFGCLGVVKSTIGVFGIIVMIASLLPVVLELSLTLLSLNLAGAVGDLLGQKRASGVLRSTSSALSIMLGLILCYGMMILVSVTIMLLMGTPG